MAFPAANGPNFPVTLDIGPAGTSQASDDGPAHYFRNRLHRLKVTIRRDGEPGLNHVHAQAVELMRQAQLFRPVHAATGRLLSVAKRGIENRYAGSL